MFSDINRPFNVSELRSFSQNKHILIGNHSHSHMIFNKINSAHFYNDVIIAQNKLRDWVGYKPFSFAFPNGDCLSYNSNLFDKAGLIYYYKVFPDCFEFIPNSKRIYLPRFMFSSENNFIDLFNAIVKQGITYNYIKSLFYINNLIRTKSF